jgi:hypothetical protein
MESRHALTALECTSVSTASRVGNARAGTASAFRGWPGPRISRGQSRSSTPSSPQWAQRSAGTLLVELPPARAAAGATLSLVATFAFLLPILFPPPQTRRHPRGECVPTGSRKVGGFTSGLLFGSQPVTMLSDKFRSSSYSITFRKPRPAPKVLCSTGTAFFVCLLRPQAPGPLCSPPCDAGCVAEPGASAARREHHEQTTLRR